MKLSAAGNLRSPYEIEGDLSKVDHRLAFEGFYVQQSGLALPVTHSPGCDTRMAYSTTRRGL